MELKTPVLVVVALVVAFIVGLKLMPTHDAHRVARVMITSPGLGQPGEQYVGVQCTVNNGLERLMPGDTAHIGNEVGEVEGYPRLSGLPVIVLDTATCRSDAKDAAWAGLSREGDDQVANN